LVNRARQSWKGCQEGNVSKRVRIGTDKGRKIRAFLRLAQFAAAGIGQHKLGGTVCCDSFANGTAGMAIRTAAGLLGSDNGGSHWLAGELADEMRSGRKRKKARQKTERRIKCQYAPKKHHCYYNRLSSAQSSLQPLFRRAQQLRGNNIPTDRTGKGDRAMHRFATDLHDNRGSLWSGEQVCPVYEGQ
jgi:hypothetical protein